MTLGRQSKSIVQLKWNGSCMDGSEQSTLYQQTPLIYNWGGVSVLPSGPHRVGRKQFSL